jgi:hypothetical protein
MRITRAIAIGPLLVLSLCAGLPNERPVKASSPGPLALKDEIIGTWKLGSRTIRQANGSESFAPSYGPNPVGYITYDSVGHMSIQQMRPDRPKKDTTDGYEAYFGTYTVDEQKKTVTHHIEGDLSPERVGKDFQRDLEINGDDLMLIVHDSTSTVVKHYSRIRAK